MRPEFRAWTEEGKAMYYDVYPFKDDTLLLSYDEIAFDEVPASDFILMQSTGLHDVHGKEVFEGDLLGTPFEEDGLFEVHMSTVAGVYTKSTLTCKLQFIGDLDSLEELELFKAGFAEYFEVKGNIFENP